LTTSTLNIRRTRDSRQMRAALHAGEQTPLSRLRKPLGQKHAEGMTDSDDFLDWIKSALYEAELAMHNGDAVPRRALWSHNEPMSILGALHAQRLWPA
jgi:hypothetical protein